MIKAILFDVDGVLIDSREINYQYFLDVFKMFGYKFVDKKNYVDKFYNLRLKEILKILIPEITDEKIDHIDKLRSSIPYCQEKKHLPKDLTRIIESLSHKFRLGIVTGRSQKSVKEYLKVSDLGRFFSALSTSEMYYNPKPDPEPLLLALKKLEIKPSEAIFVGDSLTDLQAAQALKMKFITYYGISKKRFEGEDGRAKSFEELEKVIREITRQAS